MRMQKVLGIALSTGVLLAAAVAYCQDFSYPFQFDSPFGFSDVYESFQQATGKGGGIQVGPFQLKPGLQIDANYTDNPQFRNRNKESDFYMDISPSLAFTLGQAVKFKDYVSFGYDADLGAYTKVTENDYTRHTLWADVNLLRRPTTYMRLREAITYTDDPYGNQEFVGLGTSNRRFVNQADFVVGRNLPHDYVLELGYENLWQNYLDRGFEEDSSVDHILTPTLLYELSGKTKLLAQYSFDYRNFYRQPSDVAADYTVQEVMGGVRWAASAKLTGELKGGYGWRHFLNDFDAAGFPYDDSGTPVYSAVLNYLFSPKTAIQLTASRDFLMGSGLPAGSIGAEDPASFQESITRDAFALAVNTNLRANLRFTAGGGFDLDHYDQTAEFEDRTDKIFNAGVNFKHQIRRYLWWGLGYSFEKRDSPVVTERYTANTMTASLGLAY